MSRPGWASERTVAAACAVWAGRAQMLAMQVPNTMCSVAASSTDSWAKESLPISSLVHADRYPSASRRRHASR